MPGVIKLFIFFLFFWTMSSFTSGDYTLIRSIPFSEQVFLTSDKLGNAYVIYKNQLIQYDAEGKLKGTFSINNLGELNFVDSSDPMKLVLFYPDYARLIILDSKLSVQAEIDLRMLGMDQPLAVCNSGENAYWVYDRQDDQLKKIDNNHQVIHRSGIITQITGYPLQPTTMTEDNGYVFINNPATGVLIFDRYGTYYKTLPFSGLTNFQVIDNDLLFVKNNKLYRYNSKLLSEKEILIPAFDSIRAARIEQHKLYLLTSDTLNFYYF